MPVPVPVPGGRAASVGGADRFQSKAKGAFAVAWASTASVPHHGGLALALALARKKEKAPSTAAGLLLGAPLLLAVTGPRVAKLLKNLSSACLMT